MLIGYFWQIISFVAAALASTQLFCYAAITSSSIVLILPGCEAILPRKHIHADPDLCKGLYVPLRWNCSPAPWSLAAFDSYTRSFSRSAMRLE
jgi:hypothetical protein